MGKYTVSFRDGTRTEFIDIRQARLSYFEELLRIDRGPFIPELYKHNQEGIITHRFSMVWTEIMQPTEIAESLGTKPGTKTSDNELQSENKKLREVLETIRQYANIEYSTSASCRVIASEIQQVFSA